MTTFRAQGRRGDKTVERTWTEGQLFGDPAAVAMLTALATGYEGELVGGAPGSCTTHDHLSSP